MEERKNITVVITELASCEYDYFFNELLESFKDDLIIDAGKRNGAFNDSLLKNISDCKSDIDYMIEYEEATKNDIIEYLNSKLKKPTSWTIEEIKHFEKFNYLELLKIVTGKNWITTHLYGYSQGDIIKVYYNYDIINSDTLELLKVLYFGGAYEVFFTSEETEPENIFFCDIDSFIASNPTRDYITQEIKNITGEKNANIKIYEQKEKQVIQYYYEAIQ